MEKVKSRTTIPKRRLDLGKFAWSIWRLLESRLSRVVNGLLYVRRIFEHADHTVDGALPTEKKRERTGTHKLIDGFRTREPSDHERKDRPEALGVLSETVIAPAVVAGCLVSADA